MGTHSMDGLTDFILRLMDKEKEEEIWQMWLHKERQLSYEDFKKKYFRQAYKAKVKALTKEEERKAIENATRFIKPINEGGENN